MVMEVGLLALGAGQMPTAEPDMIGQIAHTADEMGFASLWAPEHVVLFAEDAYTSRPSTASGKLAPAIADGDFLDPFVGLAFAAAHTRRIKLGTGICLVPLRNPLITAKLVASVDRLSQGRFLFGVGIGWLTEEFQALGIPPARRAQRTCEYLEAMRVLWTQEAPSFQGEFCAFPPVKSFPKPVQKPHPPIIFGGSTAPALRRAVEVGDGWLGTGLSPEQVAPLVQRLGQYAVETGRNVETLFIGVIATGQMTRERLHQYWDAGVQHLVVRFPTVAPEGLETALGELRERLVVPAQSL
jgi:probable F420-dependent oxidoreductase